MRVEQSVVGGTDVLRVDQALCSRQEEAFAELDGDGLLLAKITRATGGCPSASRF